MWDNVEFSLNVQIEVCIDLSFSWLWFKLININHLPSLVRSTMLGPYQYILILFIIASRYVKYLSFFGHDEISLESE